MVNIRRMLANQAVYGIKCPYEMEAEFIIVHNTANDASATREVRYMIENQNQVSFHYAVDDKEIVQGIPVNRNTWNAGDGGNGKGNRKGLSIEICYSKSGGSKFDKAEKNAAEFIASLLKARGWGIDRVKKHNDFCNTSCPHRTLEKGWDRFLNMIKEYLGTNEVKKEKSIDELAQEVINGKYGVGEERKKALGNKYNEVQAKVNEILLGAKKSNENKPTSARKSNETIANEVIAGDWGNGSERKERLTKEGYDYDAIQKIVNKKLGY